jgi:hypothetical protein
MSYKNLALILTGRARIWRTYVNTWMKIAVHKAEISLSDSLLLFCHSLPWNCLIHAKWWHGLLFVMLFLWLMGHFTFYTVIFSRILRNPLHNLLCLFKMRIFLFVRLLSAFLSPLFLGTHKSFTSPRRIHAQKLRHRCCDDGFALLSYCAVIYVFV